MGKFEVKVKNCLLLLISTVCMVTSQELGTDEGPFTICGIITGFKPGCQINMALYSSQEKFKSHKYTKANRLTKEKVVGDTLHYCFHGIKVGEYMVAVYQDLNGDQKINTNFLGVPTEPYQFYKPVGSRSFPNFSKCKFVVKKDIVDANLKLTVQK